MGAFVHVWTLLRCLASKFLEVVFTTYPNSSDFCIEDSALSFQLQISSTFNGSRLFLIDGQIKFIHPCLKNKGGYRKFDSKDTLSITKKCEIFCSYAPTKYRLALVPYSNTFRTRLTKLGFTALFTLYCCNAVKVMVVGTEIYSNTRTT